MRFNWNRCLSPADALRSKKVRRHASTRSVRSRSLFLEPLEMRLVLATLTWVGDVDSNWNTGAAGTQVENLSEPFMGNGVVGSPTTTIAQSFTTDSSSYLLDSITLHMNFATPDPIGFNLALHADNAGEPGALIANLSGDTSPEFGQFTYTAGGEALAANSTFWAVATVTGGTYDWAITDTNNETSLGGWTIGDALSFDSGTGWRTNPAETRLAVNATPSSPDTNWDTDTVPADGDTLVFPASGGNQSTNNDTPDGNSYTLQFTGGDYVVDGNSVTLDNPGIDIDSTGGVHRINANLVVNNSEMVIGPFNDNLRIDGVISGVGGFTKTGNGQLSLNGDNTYDGDTNLNEGNIFLGHDDGLGDPGVTTVTNLGPLTSLFINRRTVDNETLNLSGFLGLGAGVVDATWAGTIDVSGNGAMFVQGTSNFLTISGQVTGSGDANISAGGTVVFTNPANDYTGDTYITAHLALGASEVIPNTSDVNIAASSSLDLRSFTEQIDALTGDGIVESSGGTGALTVGTSNGSGTFGGTIQDGSGVVNFHKVGAGEQVLTGNSSYSAHTNVLGGMLTVVGSLATSNVNLSGGAALRVTGSVAAGNVSIANLATLEGTGTVNATIQIISNMLPGGTISPGLSPGVLSTGSVDLEKQTLAIEIDGATPGVQHDQLNVNGTVAINNASLQLSGSANPSPGDSYVVINNDGGDSVSGTFLGLPEGGVIPNFLGSGFAATITYQGGDGNDVVLNLESRTDLPGIYMSFTTTGVVDGLLFRNEDILSFDGNNWSLHFDGSDVGLRTADIDALHVEADTSILMSFRSPIYLRDVGRVDDSDIVRFSPSSTGENTAGSFSMFLRGADLGLTTSLEDVDAIGRDSSGRLVVSTLGTFSVPATSGGSLAGSGEDVIVLNGGVTTGDWELLFDGSTAGLTASSEGINGVDIQPNGDLNLVTRGRFSVPGLAGDANDIFTCNGGGPCGYALLFEGDAEGLRFKRIDAISLVARNTIRHAPGGPGALPAVYHAPPSPPSPPPASLINPPRTEASGHPVMPVADDPSRDQPTNSGPVTIGHVNAALASRLQDGFDAEDLAIELDDEENWSETVDEVFADGSEF